MRKMWIRVLNSMDQVCEKRKKKQLIEIESVEMERKNKNGLQDIIKSFKEVCNFCKISNSHAEGGGRGFSIKKGLREKLGEKQFK